MRSSAKLLCAVLLCCFNCINILAEDEETTEETEPIVEVFDVDIASDTAVLIDADSGKVLFEKHKDDRIDPASLTKIMTVYLASRALPESQDVTMSKEAYQLYNHSSSVLWIQEGETMSAGSAMHATLLASANDTCAMLVEATSITQIAFLQRMNTALSEMELTNSNFDNVYGNSGADNYSTAYDIAMITRYALKEPLFKKVFTSSGYTIPPTNMMDQKRPIPNDCELVRNGAYAYANATGGKIGYTAEGGYAISASASKNGTNLIAVVAGEATADAAYRDTIALFDYGFENWQTLTITADDIGTKVIEIMENHKHALDVVFKVDGDFSILLPTTTDTSTLETEIEVLNEDEKDPNKMSAKVVFKLDGSVIGYATMEKELVGYDTSFSANEGTMLAKLYDYFSIVVLGLVVLFPLLLKLEIMFKPPEV